MILEIIVTVVLVGYALHTTYRGVSLLQNKEIVLGIKREGKVYSRLSPRDKQLFGVVYIAVGVFYLITTALAFMGLTSGALYNLSWLLLFGVVLGGPTLMKRRSTYVAEDTHQPEMPTLES